MSWPLLSKLKPLNLNDKDTKIAWLEYQVDSLKWQLVLAYRKELEPFMERYKEKAEEAAGETKELREKIIALRRQLRSGEIDNKQYQKRLTPLNKEKKAIAAALKSFVYHELDDMIPEHNITPDEIEKYLKETREWEITPRFLKSYTRSHNCHPQED